MISTYTVLGSTAQVGLWELVNKEIWQLRNPILCICNHTHGWIRRLLQQQKKIISVFNEKIKDKKVYLIDLSKY